MAKSYRFFYHYFKQNNCMSVHYQKQCIQCKDIVCTAATESKWKPAQPRLVIQGFASSIEKIGETIYIHK